MAKNDRRPQLQKSRNTTRVNRRHVSDFHIAQAYDRNEWRNALMSGRFGDSE